MIYVKILEWLRQGRKFMELFNKIPSSSPNLISEPTGLNIAQCFQSRLQSSNGCHRRWRPSLVGFWLGLTGLCNIKIFAASRATRNIEKPESKFSSQKPSPKVKLWIGTVQKIFMADIFISWHWTEWRILSLVLKESLRALRVKVRVKQVNVLLINLIQYSCFQWLS